MATPKREVAIAFALAMFSMIGYSEAFDSFWSVQQWPPGVCAVQSGNCVGSGLRMFTIHGLWPQQSGKSLLNCPGKSFDFHEISSKTTNYLNDFWPDIINGNNKKFWDKEWTKHGTCSEPPFDQAAYFQLALDHRSKYDILKALESRGAGPNGQKKVTKDVKSYIKKAFGMFPGLRCKLDENKKSYLTEVVLCFGPDAKTLIDCRKDSCGEHFYF